MGHWGLVLTSVRSVVTMHISIDRNIYMYIVYIYCIYIHTNENIGVYIYIYTFSQQRWLPAVLAKNIIYIYILFE